MDTEKELEEIKLITNRMGRQYYIYANDKLYEQRFARENGPYQVRNLIMIRTLCPNAHTIIDIGMNIANNTIEYSTWAKKVIGFEPYTETFNLAKKNIFHNKKRKLQGRYYNSTKKKYEHDINHNDGWWKEDKLYASLNMTGIIEIHNIALGEKNTKTKMIHHINNAGHNHIDIQGKKIKNKRVNITMKTLDSYNFNNISAIKLDVEGYEKFIIQGGKSTIIKNRPVVQVEIVKENYKRFGYTPQDLLDYFFLNFKNYIFCDFKKNNIGKIWIKTKGVMDYFFVPKEIIKNKQKKLSDLILQYQTN